MHKTYPQNITVEFSTKSKIIQCILLIPLIIVSAIMALLPVIWARGAHGFGVYFFPLLGILLVLGFSYSLASAFKAKIIFHNDRVVQIGVFKTRTVLYKDIQGYCIGEIPPVNLSKPERILSLIPCSDNGSKQPRWINIDLKRSRVSKYLLSFIKKEFPNLTVDD